MTAWWGRGGGFVVKAGGQTSSVLDFRGGEPRNVVERSKGGVERLDGGQSGEVVHFSFTS